MHCISRCNEFFPRREKLGKPKWWILNLARKKEISEWFCGRQHWNLAYDGCMKSQKIRQCMHQECTDDELQGGLCLSHGANNQKWNYPGGCTQKALDNVGVCAKQAEGGGQWEKLAVTRGAKNKPKIRMCVSSMVMVQRWNVAAMGGAPAPTRLWREEHVEVIGHLMRLVGNSSSSDVPFFWCRINWLDIYYVMKFYIGSWAMGLSMVCMKGVCPLYTDPNRLCKKHNRTPPPF